MAKWDTVSMSKSKWLWGLVGLGILAGCSSGSATPQSAPAPPTTTTTTIDPTVAAGASYVSAFNTMNTASNDGITKQNTINSDPAGATAGINEQISARQAFDTAVTAIVFPSAAQSDAQQVLSADAALEQALGTLAVNTDNIANFNSVFATVTPAQNVFTSANAALSNDLGLKPG